LTIELENSGDACAKDVIVTAVANAPFITDQTPSSNPITICNGQFGKAHLSLILESNTIGGTYPLTLVVNYLDNSTGAYTFSNTINLLVEGNSDLNAHIINSNPLDVYPGDTATISVLVENDGTVQAQSISGVLSSKDTLEIKSAQSFFSVGSLQPKQSYIASFSLDVPKDAQAESYPMALSLVYSENDETKNKDIPLIFDVKKRALFSVSDGGSDILYPKDSGKIIRVNIRNIGTNAAKELKIQVQPQFPFTTDGSIKYIPDLEPGQSDVVEFAINIDKDATVGNYGISLILDFKDSQGNSLYDTATAPLTIQNKGVFQKVFIDYWYLWILLELIAVIMLLRVSRKKGEKEVK
jgi:hypothetical protein